MTLTSTRYWDLIDVKRADWDPKPKKLRRSRAARTIDTIQGVEIHYAGDSNGTVDADPVDRLNIYKRYHVKTKGWSDLFYNVALSTDGRIFEGRYAVRMSQVSTKQWLTVLCLCGTEPLTPEQSDKFAELIEEVWLAVSPSKDPAWLRCHRDRGATQCPGNDLAAVVHDLKGGWTAHLGGKPSVSARILKRGSRGSDVGSLQTLLNFWNDAELQVDNIFGRVTERAVQAWQVKLTVAAHGAWGPGSRAAHGKFVEAVDASAKLQPGGVAINSEPDDLPATQRWVTDNFIAKV